MVFRQKSPIVRWITGELQFARVCEDRFAQGGLNSFFEIYKAIFDAQNPLDADDPIHLEQCPYSRRHLQMFDKPQRASIRFILYDGGIYHPLFWCNRREEPHLYGCTRKSKLVIVPSQEGITLDGLL